MEDKMPLSKVHISHGSGTGLNELLHSVVLPALLGKHDAPLEDAAVFNLGFNRIAFTTDSFVVHPLEFPGGDIGKLAACGTINDLAMMGAQPMYLSVGLIIEESLDTVLLSRILQSLRTICVQNNMVICCGDTKVVERGKADGIFINTSGIGFIPPDRNISVTNARPGDAVLVSGPIGLHGITILAKRENLGFASTAVSDCASLSDCVETLLLAVPTVHVLRDPTRGGCAAILNEIAGSSQVTIRLNQQDIPIPPVVASACSFLGFDPLHIANEGRFIAMVPPQEAKKAVDILHTHPMGSGAAIIGVVEKAGRFPVIIQTEIGGVRPVEIPPGRLLPRIC
jgi:hydrogenase expression/formation protein HypE